MDKRRLCEARPSRHRAGLTRSWCNGAALCRTSSWQRAFKSRRWLVGRTRTAAAEGRSELSGARESLRHRGAGRRGGGAGRRGDGAGRRVNTTGQHDGSTLLSVLSELRCFSLCQFVSSSRQWRSLRSAAPPAPPAPSFSSSSRRSRPTGEVAPGCLCALGSSV